jgi:hypothetical protein
MHLCFRLCCISTLLLSFACSIYCIYASDYTASTLHRRSQFSQRFSIYCINASQTVNFSAFLYILHQHFRHCQFPSDSRYTVSTLYRHNQFPSDSRYFALMLQRHGQYSTYGINACRVWVQAEIGPAGQ